MKQVNVHQAKSQLSQLLADAEAGEEVVIARAGKPVVKLTPVKPQPRGAERWPNRKPGRLKGKIPYVSDEEWARWDKEIAEMMMHGETDEELFGPPPK